MDKEKLIAMGLTEEQAKKVMEALDGAFVTKTRFNEVNEELKTAKKTIGERDKQLEELKKSSGDNDDLKKQIQALQDQNAEQKKTHEKEMTALRLENAVDTALMGAGAKNVKAVKSLLDMTKLKQADDGTVPGLKEAIDTLKKSDGYMFEDAAAGKGGKQQMKGFQPGASGNEKPGDKVDTTKMTYSEMIAYLEQNPGAKLD